MSQLIRSFFRRPLDDVMPAMEHLMTRGNPAKVMLPMLGLMLGCWFVYVPIHELLHCYGCIWTGGTVTELELQAHYGGNWLKPYFPFIVTGSAYAGRLSGFDTKGNDWIYLATDFGPFALSVLFGVSLLRLCARKRRPWLTAPAFVVGLAPFYNIQGDYYEMGSTIVTRVLTLATGGGNPPRFEGLRSDDIFTLVPDILLNPAKLGLDPRFSTTLFALLVFLLGMTLSVLLAFATYQLGDLVARLTIGSATPFTLPKPRKRRRKRKPAL